jgi:hypothetical protein
LADCGASLLDALRGAVAWRSIAGVALIVLIPFLRRLIKDTSVDDSLVATVPPR